MARSNPIGKIKDTALDTIKGSVTTTQGVVGQAVDKARDTVETVTALVPGRKSAPKKSGAAVKARAPRVPAVETESSRKVQGDPLAPAASKATTKASGKKAPAKKTVAKKTVAKKAAVKKAPAKKAAAKKAPVTTGAATATPADVAKKSATKAPAKKAPAKKAAAKKTAAKKTAAKKAPAKKAAATKAPAKRTSPAVEVETVYSTSSDSPTPSTTQKASTETALIDPGTAKATLTEAETLARAADPHKG